MTSGVGFIAALLALAAPAPAPREPECSPVFAARLKAGCWGLVRVEVANSSGARVRAVLGQGGEGAKREVIAGAASDRRRLGPYLVPFRPLSEDGPLWVRVGESSTVFPGRVAAANAPLVVEVAPAGAPDLPLPVDLKGRVRVEQLPEWGAAYEGVDLLIIHDLGGCGLKAAQRKALFEWYRAGGRVVITSEKALLAAADIFLNRPAAKPPKNKAEWRELVGGVGADDDVWRNGRPVLVGFGAGFGRGLLALPDGQGGADWVEAAGRSYRDRLPPVAPLVRARLYHDPREARDFPTLEGAMVGSGAALRWALAAALFLAAAGAFFWRRSRPARLALAVAVAAAVAAVGVGFLARRDFRTLSVRIEEFSADGAGVRTREYLYVEKTGGPARAEVRAAPGVLPSPILFRASEADGISCRMELAPKEEGGGFRLLDLSFGEGSLFLGAGPLPGAAAMKKPPPGATYLQDISAPMKADEAVRAIADCLADPGSRLRAQAEFLARAIWEELFWRNEVIFVGAVPRHFTVCRLPEEKPEPAMRVEGRVEPVRLGRLGIFYGER